MAAHIRTERGEEIRLPVGGSFVISDANGRQLFRVESDGDVVKAGDVPLAGGGGGGGGIDYVQDADPGAVGAGKTWLQTDPSGNTATLQLFVRKSDDSGWLKAGAADVVGNAVFTQLLAVDTDFATFSAVEVFSNNTGPGNTYVEAVTAQDDSQATWRLYPDGYTLYKGVNTAPDDTDLQSGNFAIWFDQTNGAAKLMVKAKTADGTVVAGSVDLA
jgi:hypothetical protein